MFRKQQERKNMFYHGDGRLFIPFQQQISEKIQFLFHLFDNNFYKSINN